MISGRRIGRGSRRFSAAGGGRGESGSAAGQL